MSFQQGLSGLNAAAKNLDVIGNNVANSNTIGFKGSQAQFADVFANSLTGATGSAVGIGTSLSAVRALFGQGNINVSANPLDLAINGQGFFQVQLPDGTTAYTRDGSFHLDSQGQIVTSNGFTLSPAITLPANTLSITISQDGVVSATQSGSATPTQIGSIQLATFVNSAGPQPRSFSRASISVIGCSRQARRSACTSAPPPAPPRAHAPP